MAAFLYQQRLCKCFSLSIVCVCASLCHMSHDLVVILLKTFGFRAYYGA